MPHLGTTVKAPSGWEVREEMSPVPNVAMVSIWNPEFANVPNAEVPGAVPVIILSVEDIRGENLNLVEFKERSKQLSLQQMLMMTGGAISPQVRKDTDQQIGPYRHIVEYAQSLPPYLDIYVINLLEVRNGIAHVFQIMCNPKVMNEHRSVFLQIAKDTIITPLTSSALGYLSVYTGAVEAKIDTTWSWSLPDASEDGVLAKFQLASSVKREEITLYKADSVPQSDLKIREEKEIDGVKIVSAFDGTQERKTVTYGDYALVVRPQQKAVSYLNETALVETIKSVKPSTEAPKPKGGATFTCPEYGYRFNIVGGGHVVATKLGNGTLVYAPLGVPQDMTQETSPEQQGPTVTVRSGSPDNDPDCMGSLEEWHSRMKEEASEGSIHNIKLTKIKDKDCLTFTSKEMQEVGPNQKVEVKGNVYIFVRDGVTTLIRWETTTSQWRKFERDLDAFLESFEFLN
ncbi:hypothetical protein AGDE_07178 [Angomonas deanei]|nr:hypothetical protein AGDE_07178 [Angomonas deanei]|eukprot:EPY35909.1 hypothetical protein AGDE_07178 [Angomonas deanei]